MRTFELHSGDGAASAEMDRLKADNARLRALLAQTHCDSEGECFFCRALWVVSPDRPLAAGKHKTDCPAFTPEGVVK